MKAAQIFVGGVYMSMAEGVVQPVKVIGTTTSLHHKHPHTEYRCSVVATGRPVLVKFVTRFRRVATQQEIQKSKENDNV